MKLEEKLIVLRKKKGLSQQELAEQLNVSRQAISRWEVGSAIPSTDNLRSLCQLYNVSLDYLINDDTAEPSPTDEKASGETSAPLNRTRRNKTAVLLLAIIEILALFLAVHLLTNREENYTPIENIEGSNVNTVGSFEIEIDW